ncbi:MAG: EMC3/TMCO1 family protein [Candidatus Njordarchaeota archaeon]
MDPCLIFLIGALVINSVRVITEFLFVDPKKVKTYSSRVSEWRRKAREAMKSRDPRMLARVQREKKIIDALTYEISKMRMKSMIILMLTSITIFYIVINMYRNVSMFVPLLNINLAGVWFFALISFAISSIASIPLKWRGYI